MLTELKMCINRIKIEITSRMHNVKINLNIRLRDRVPGEIISAVRQIYLFWQLHRNRLLRVDFPHNRGLRPRPISFAYLRPASLPDSLIDHRSITQSLTRDCLFRRNLVTPTWIPGTAIFRAQISTQIGF